MLGQGFGTPVMKLALDHCFSDPTVSAILINPLASNVRSRRFYERLAFEYIESRRFGADECSVYRLSRDRWQSRNR